jgi:hypothetical protein
VAWCIPDDAQARSLIDIGVNADELQRRKSAHCQPVARQADGSFKFLTAYGLPRVVGETSLVQLPHETSVAGTGATSMAGRANFCLWE